MGDRRRRQAPGGRGVRAAAAGRADPRPPCTRVSAAWRCGSTFRKSWLHATGFGVFVYSRAGYGRSDPVDLPRPLDYMTREARFSLPAVLDAIGFRHGVLLGHSDGA